MEKEQMRRQVEETSKVNMLLEADLSKYRVELTQIKAHFQSLQIEAHKSQIWKEHALQTIAALEGQIGEKHSTIGNLIEQSRMVSSALASQLHQVKQ